MDQNKSNFVMASFHLLTYNNLYHCGDHLYLFDYEGLINPCPKIICNCRTLFYYKTCSMLDVIQSQKVTHATREEVTDDPQDAVKNAREIFKCSCSRIYYTNTFFVKSTKKIKNLPFFFNTLSLCLPQREQSDQRIFR